MTFYIKELLLCCFRWQYSCIHL